MIDMLRHFIGLSSDTADSNGNVIQSLRAIQSNFESGVRGQQNMRVFTETTPWTPPADANILYFMTVNGGQAGYMGTTIPSQFYGVYPAPTEGARGANGTVSFFEIRRLSNVSFTITVGAGGIGGDGQRGGTSTVSTNRTGNTLETLRITQRTGMEVQFQSGANPPEPALPQTDNIDHAAANSGLGGGGGGEPRNSWGPSIFENAGRGSNGGSGVVVVWW